MKPVYLSNYEMLQDPRFCAFAREKQDRGLCEIGMHLHAWNCPPMEETLPARTDCVPGAAYLIEYSEEAMEEKIRFMTELITEKMGLLRSPTGRAVGLRMTGISGFFKNTAIG